MSLLIDNMLFYGLLLFGLISCLSKEAQNIVAALLLLCFIAKGIIEKKWLISNNSLTGSIGLFFVAVAVSAFFGLDVESSMSRWFEYLFHFSVFFVAAFSLKTPKQVDRILLALATSITLFDLSAIWQWINGILRPSGFFESPAILGKHLTILVPILFIQVLYKPQYKFAYIPALLLSFFALMINQTRGTWVALAITAIVGFMLMRQYRKQMLIYITVMLILLFFLFSLNSQLLTRFHTIFDMQFKANLERLVIWHNAVQMIKDYPVTGVGLGNFRMQYIKYLPPSETGSFTYAHNNVLHMFAVTGILGGIAFLYMFFTLFKTYYHDFSSTSDWKRSIAITGMFVTIAFFLQGMTEYMFAHSVTTKLFWFVSGILYGSLQIKECK